MGYGKIASQLISGIGGAVAGGLNAGTQTDQRNAILAAYGALPSPPNLQNQFQQGWNAQNAMTPAQVYSDYKLRSMYAPEEQKQAFNLYSQYAPQYAQENLALLKKVDPQYLNGYRQLGADLSNDLSAGSSLTPQQLQLANSYVDSSQAARGNVLGNANVAGNALYDAQQGQALYQQRIGNMEGYLQNGGPESKFGALGGNQALQSLGQGMQNLTNPGMEYYQLPQNWGQEYASLGQEQYQDDYQRSLQQAQATASAPPSVNPWIASLSAGFGALAGNAQSGGLTPAGAGATGGSSSWSNSLFGGSTGSMGSSGGSQPWQGGEPSVSGGDSGYNSAIAGFIG